MMGSLGPPFPGRPRGTSGIRGNYQSSEGARGAPNTSHSQFGHDRGRARGRGRAWGRDLCMMGSLGPPFPGRPRGTSGIGGNYQSSEGARGAPNTSHSQFGHGRGRARGRGRAWGSGREGGGQRGAQSLNSLADIDRSEGYRNSGGQRGSHHSREDGDNTAAGGRWKKREFPMGYKVLENLASSTPDVMVLEMLNEKSGFILLLQLEDISPDRFDLLVKVLSGATCSQSNKEGMYELFNKIIEMKFIDKLTMHSVEVKRCYPERAGSFFTNLIKFLTAVAEAMTTIAIDKLPNSIDIILSALSSLIRNGYVSEELVKRYEDLQEWLTEQAKKWEYQQKLGDKGKGKVRQDMDHLQPPDDYREIPVLPSSLDISSNLRPFLRKNIVEGKYRDGNHYLDVQFRLLREDFVRPLRNGINDFKSDVHKKINDVRIYKHITINGPQLMGRKIFHSVKMNQMGRMKLENSKRLLFGNLLCFSKDNFCTLILGSVADRDLNKLKEGILGVQFESDIEFHDLSGEFVMVESRAYFMAYKHVLKALQDISDDAIPMEPYIVHVQPNVEPPRYLDLGRDTYDLRGLKNPKIMKKSEAYSELFQFDIQPDIEEPVEGELMHLNNIPIGGQLCAWPTTEELGLDDSQLRALRSALTRQLAIIQGPPGTGKTFLGLKIVQTLLHNSSVWKTDHHPKPVLVVCFTNHALDQFLEGMTSYTTNIVRVGSRTKSEIIGNFQINSLVRTLGRGLPRNIRERNYQVHSELQSLEHSIGKLRAMIDECNACSGILSLDLLVCESIVPQHMQHQLETVNHDRKLAAWLLYDINPQNAFALGKQVSSHDNGNAVKSRKDQSPIKSNEKEGGAADDDDVKEFLEIQERDRILEVYEEDVKPLLVSADLHYEVRDTYLLEDILKFQEMYEQMGDEEALLRLNIANGQREVLRIGFSLPEIPMEMDQLEQRLQNIWSLAFPKRWQLYKYWLRKLEEKAENKLKLLDVEFKKKARAMDEVRNQEYLHCLRNASIVGMTTTGAAQYNSVLQDLAPSIVVIEEAAEILESHVLTSLTAQCQHLIMIGDHQQLRPSATVYELATKFGLETSLFERMIKNGLVYETLEYQHRMRPDISRLLVPAVYPKLKDHPSVHKFPNIRGITKNIFFVTHQIYERAEADDNNSHENVHEAELVMGLCRHLMLQGYSSDDITILTPYSGQFFLLRKLQRAQVTCTGVRICVVDNFQGEENKIILLSLVRSNIEGKVGFLSTENRVCVALSRAKHGLYITGNINLLSDKSELWRKIQNDLTSKESIGDSLTLQCSNHPEQLMAVSSGKDFILKSPEGGCLQVCGRPLPRCRHSCPKLCHMDDLEHELYRCQVPCPKILCSLDHQCPMKCWQKCDPCMVPLQKLLPCGHTHSIYCHVAPESYNCPTLVVKELPHCQHKVKMHCHQSPKYFPCPVDCDTRVDCGHKCRLKCHRTEDPDHMEYSCYEKCTKINAGCTQNHPCLKKCYEDCGSCTVLIDKKLSCLHAAINVECSEPLESIKCHKKCKRTLDCGHHCKKLCYQDCGDCHIMVKKTIPACLHEASMPCCKLPAPKYCDGPCPKKLPCGHPCTHRCKDQCTDKCQELVNTVNKCPKGHVIKLPCHLATDVKGEDAWQFCKEPCNKMLDCDHSCVGDCGRCLQGRLHMPCNMPCRKSLVCGHICKQPCSADCPPCQETCQWRCVHSRCRKPCGTPCIPCKESCEWACEHQKCQKLCGSQCSRKPCDHPCKKTLKCGHPCIGFCGDPCPPLCRECDKEELTDFMLIGNEDEPDARFVVLEDCGHTIEAEGLEGWLKQETAEIGMKKCPKCRATIYNNRRYQHIILETYKTVETVKAQYNKHSARNKVTKKNIVLILQNPNFYSYCSSYAKKLSITLGIGSKKHKYHSDGELQLLHLQSQILEKAVTVLQSSEGEDSKQTRHRFGLRPPVRQETKDQKRLKQKVHAVLDRIMNKSFNVAPQMMREVSCELQRLMILPAYWKFQEKILLNSNDILMKIKAKLEKLMDPTVLFDEELEKKVCDLLKASEQYFGGLGITDEERIMIRNAMKMKQGHWYKCPNGHVYCIIDCGRAVEESRCPTCKAVIGGLSYRLSNDNTVATEMD